MTVFPISEILYNEIENIGIDRQKLVLWLVVHQWDEIVGKEIASVTFPYDVTKDSIKVKVSDSCWKQELYLRKGDILKAIERKFGCGTVRDIIFCVGKVRKRSKWRYATQHRKRELNGSEKEWVEKVSFSIDDPSLRSVVKDVLKSYLECQKGE